MVTLIISGGQTGADLGGLLAGRELGIATGGTAPQGWLTEEGPRESILRSFGLMECAEPGYAARTKANVLHADGTLIVGPYASGGTALTARRAHEAGKPLFHVSYPEAGAGEDRVAAFRQWLREHQVRILNVAGNRESQNPGICEFTRTFLCRALGRGSSWREK